MHMTMIKTDTYHIKDNFFVDIVTDDITHVAWIYNDEYCTKQMMFGVSITNSTYEEFLEVVENNLYDYITSYVDDIFDYDERKEFYAKNNNIQSR